MTAKEFVLQRHPTALAERYNSGRLYTTSRYSIRELGNSMCMGDGKTESQAWKRAKDIIFEREKTPAQ